MGLRDFIADVGFRTRRAVPWSPPARLRPARSWDVLSSLSEEAKAAARALRATHAIDHWPQWLSARELHEALYVLDVLHRFLQPPASDLPCLDVGSKNGLTLPALFAAVPGPWDLVELDAHRRYLDLSTRAAFGARITQAHPGSRYIAASVSDVVARYRAITWFLPFVHEAPLRAWGLPQRFFQPAQLLVHVLGSLAPGGILFVVNQGEGEHVTQGRLLSDCGATAEDLGQLQSPLSPFRRPRFAFRVQQALTHVH